jgi:hypothetical protein
MIMEHDQRRGAAERGLAKYIARLDAGAEPHGPGHLPFL